jgi:hypothetical protein
VDNRNVYPWFTAYASAVLETDNAKMPSRIQEAPNNAIDDRLPSPRVLDTREQTEIEASRKALVTLKAERVDGLV